MPRRRGRFQRRRRLISFTLVVGSITAFLLLVMLTWEFPAPTERVEKTLPGHLLEYR